MQLSKQLLGSTAILSIGAVAGLVTLGAGTAGVAQAEGHQSVNVSGFFRHEVFGGDLEEKLGGNPESFDFATDSEVHVNYRATDEETGLRYGATIEFETDTDSTNQDEAWMFIGGGFGEIRLGDEDGSSDNLKIGGFTIAEGTGGIDGEGSVGSTAFTIGNSSDNTKIRYDSPSIGGFQLSVSYTPNDDNGTGRAANSGYENFVEGGLAYSGSFGGLDVEASGVFGVNSGENGNDDFEGYGVGALIGFSGFTVAAGFFHDEDANSNERDMANAGIAASLGPAAVSYTFNFADDEASGNEETNHVVSASVGLLPGVSLDADVSIFDEDIDTGEDGVTGVARLGVSF